MAYKSGPEATRCSDKYYMVKEIAGIFDKSFLIRNLSLQILLLGQPQVSFLFLSGSDTRLQSFLCLPACSFLLQQWMLKYKPVSAKAATVLLFAIYPDSRIFVPGHTIFSKCFSSRYS